MNDLSRVFIFCAAIALTGCAEEDPQQYISEGQALFEKGDMEAARVQFKNAMQLDPRLVETYYGLALLDEKEKNWSAMKANLQEVIRLDPGHADAHVKLGFLLMGNLDKAKEQVEIALKLEPENINTLLLKSHILYQEKNYAEAISLTEKILKIEPDKADAFWLKATIQGAQQQNDQALFTLKDGLKKNPGNVELGLLKIKLYASQKNIEAALQEYDDLISSHQHDKSLYISRINMLSQHGKKDLVETNIRKGIDDFPDDAGFRIALVDYLLAVDQIKAEALLQKNVSDYPQEVHFKSSLAEIYMVQKKYQQALPIYKEITSADPTGNDGLAAKVRQAEIALIQKDDKLAQQLLDEVLVTDQNNIQALLLRADIRLGSKDADGAISDLRIVLRDKPEVERAILFMAQAHALKDEIEVAESYWRKALEINSGNVVAIVSLNARLIKRGDVERAEDILNKAIKGSPDNQMLNELLVKLKVYEKDWAGAELAINAMEKQTKAIFAAQILRAELAEKQGDLKKTIGLYQDVLKKQPKDANVLASLARAYEVAGNRSGYITFLQAFNRQNPDDINVYNELGRMYVLENKWGDATNILQKTLQLDGLSVATYRMLAGVMERQGESDRIIGLYRDGLTKSPNNPDLILELANYQTRIGKTQEAMVLYEGLLEKSPEFDEAANNLAGIILANNPDQAGLERALLLTERFKESRNPYFLDTYGWVLFKTGEFDKAVVSLKKSAKSVSDNADIRYHLGEALYAVGDYSASKLELEQVILLAQQRQGEFVEIKRAKELLKEIAASKGG